MGINMEGLGCFESTDRTPGTCPGACRWGSRAPARHPPRGLHVLRSPLDSALHLPPRSQARGKCRGGGGFQRENKSKRSQQHGTLPFPGLSAPSPPCRGGRGPTSQGPLFPFFSPLSLLCPLRPLCDVSSLFFLIYSCL